MEVLIITGAPATGKTTLGRRLALDLSLPFVSKDDIKEILFDTIGWKDRAWSQHLAVACYGLMYHFMETELSVGRSLAVESNFDREHSTPRFLDLQRRRTFRPIQILCYAEGAALMQRYVERDRAGVRHPGHIDGDAYRDIEAVLSRGRIEPLDLDGPVVEVDTTNFSSIDYPAILQEVRDAIRSG